MCARRTGFSFPVRGDIAEQTGRYERLPHPRRLRAFRKGIAKVAAKRITDMCSQQKPKRATMQAACATMISINNDENP
eukprot:893141-Pelagomonas_calceolata.AAC.6